MPKYYKNNDNWILTPIKPNPSPTQRVEFYILNKDLTHKLGTDMGMKSKQYANKKMTTLDRIENLKEIKDEK